MQVGARACMVHVVSCVVSALGAFGAAVMRLCSALALHLHGRLYERRKHRKMIEE